MPVSHQRGEREASQLAEMHRDAMREMRFVTRRAGSSGGGRFLSYGKAIADGAHRAMVEAIGIPADDHFQVMTEHALGAMIYDPQYLGVRRSDGVVFVQIAMSFGREPQQKRQLFKRTPEILAETPGLRKEDLLINLVEVAWENWSFGNGEAQYMDA